MARRVFMGHDCEQFDKLVLVRDAIGFNPLVQIGLSNPPPTAHRDMAAEASAPYVSVAQSDFVLNGLVREQNGRENPRPISWSEMITRWGRSMRREEARLVITLLQELQ